MTSNIKSKDADPLAQFSVGKLVFAGVEKQKAWRMAAADTLPLSAIFSSRRLIADAAQAASW